MGIVYSLVLDILFLTLRKLIVFFFKNSNFHFYIIDLKILLIEK